MIDILRTFRIRSSLFAFAVMCACRPDAADLPPDDGAGPPAPTVATPTPEGAGGAWVIGPADPTFEALLLHDPIEEDPVAAEAFASFARGLAVRGFATTLVGTAEGAIPPRDFDLYVLAGTTQQTGTLRRVEAALAEAPQRLSPAPLAVLVVGRGPLKPRLADLVAAARARGAIVVEARAFGAGERETEDTAPLLALLDDLGVEVADNLLE